MNNEEYEKKIQSENSGINLPENYDELNNTFLMQEKMLDLLGCGIFCYTVPKRSVLVLNQEARRIFGYKDVNVDGNELMKSIVPEDIGKLRNAVKSLVSPGDSTEYVIHLQHENGTFIAARTFTKLLSFSNGQQFILSSMSDITDEEIMERRLVDERSRYRDALAFGSEVFFTMDITAGVIKNHIYSKSGEIFTEKIGQKPPVEYDTFAAAWLSHNRVVLLKNDAEIIKGRENIIEYFKKGFTRIDIEYFLPAENRFFNVQVLLSQSEVDEHIHASFFIYDTTEERKEERKNKDVIYSLGKIYYSLYHFSVMSDSYVCVRQHGDIEGIVPQKGMISKFRRFYVDNYVEPEFRDKVNEFMEMSTLGERLKDKDFDSIEYKRKNLGWCRSTFIAAEKNENGELISAVWAVNFIESQKQAELIQQEALKTALKSANMANNAKTDFLANMSHDIRTPMNAIIGMTAIAGTHIDDKNRVADCLSKITLSSKHLLGLINDVLDMSKIESGKMELQEEEFNLPELIDNLIVMSKPLIAEKNHTISITIHNIEHENVIGDSQHIQQAFMNIMSNAIKYTPDNGKLKLSICEKTINKPHVGCYEFVFEDNGIGMSQEFINHIFEPFVRANEDSRINNIKGTGLGMPITKNIVQMMNGSINIESELNKGTRITIEIMLKLQNTNENISYDKFVDLPILVVDDESIACEATCEMLKDLGMKSEGVNNGKDAVEKVIEHHNSGNDFFAVIIDWKMPGMDGVSTTKAIRKHVGKNISIIIISAYDWSDIELEARAAGANAFISKPLFKSRMAHLFSEIVSGADMNEQTSGLDNFKSTSLEGKRALLAEDNELNAEIAGEILGMTGLEVEYAQNGREAFDMMSASSDGYYDVVFMDIQMPVMNGYEAARAIRSLPRDYAKSVPIIAMTANAFAEDVTAAKNAGMNEHIAKPLDFDQLRSVLKKWLE